jgi:hypothetical protein
VAKVEPSAGFMCVQCRSLPTATRCSSRLRHRLAEEAVGSEEVIALQRPRPMSARRPCRGVDRSSKVHLVEAAGGQPGQRSRCSAACFQDFRSLMRPRLQTR